MYLEDFVLQRRLLRIGHRLYAGRNNDIKEFGLTPNQSETLMFCGKNQGAPITRLKTWLNVSHQATCSVVERMKAKDLLSVTDSPDDGRAKAIYLTEKGRELYDILAGQGDQVGHRLLADFTPEEKQILSTLLQKMEKNL